jgi:16S rRNA (guanine527-N7)-methyltransferase
VCESGAVDRQKLEECLIEGSAKLDLGLTPEAIRGLGLLAEELLRWNARVNLTAVTSEAAVAEKHLLDSLAVLPELEGARSLLDLGAGAGFPGLPLKLLRPELEVTLVDSVGKKVGFMKHAIARLGLKGARALHLRAEGKPEREGLPRTEVVISRALMDVGEWTHLAAAYAEPGGRVVAMLGKSPAEEDLKSVAQASGLELVSLRRYALPFSGDPRAVAVFRRP